MPTTFTDGTKLTGANLTAALATATADAVAQGLVSSVAGRTGAVTLSINDVTGAAPLVSPVLTGAPAAPTAAPGTNTTQIASTAFVAAAVVASTTGVATFNGRTGGITLTSSDVTTALSFTPYNATNPTGYQTAAQVTTTLGAYAPLASPAFSGSATAVNLTTTGVTALKGSITNDAASAGQVGEYVSSTVLVGSAVSMTSNTAGNITSISLTAGDWHVWGSVQFYPAGGAAITQLAAWIGTTSATQPTLPAGGAFNAFNATFTTGSQQSLSAGVTRISLSGTTTVYLGAQSFFSSTMTGGGFIGARRVR